MFEFSAFGRTKELFEKIKKLEDKLDAANFLPLREQEAIHKEIRALKAEVKRLEQRRT